METPWPIKAMIAFGIALYLLGCAIGAEPTVQQRAAAALKAACPCSSQICPCNSSAPCNCDCVTGKCSPDCPCEVVVKLENFEYTCSRAKAALASAQGSQQTESHQTTLVPASPSPAPAIQFQAAPAYYYESSPAFATLGSGGGCANGSCSGGLGTGLFRRR